MELKIAITFETNRYHGRVKEEDLEWPPSPLRLFQALIAGSHRGVYGIINQDVRDESLKWLEKLAPPIVESCGVVESCRELTNYVPNNDNDIEHVKTKKPVAAKVLSQAKPVVYRWQFPDDKSSRKNAAVICAMTSLVTHLGQHQDLVYARGEIVESENTQREPSSIVFEPSEEKDGQWKSPSEGTLDACKRRYQGVLKGESPFDYMIPCRKIDYQNRNVITMNAPMALFELWQTGDRRLVFEPRNLRQPAGMVRNAAIAWLDENPSFGAHYGAELTSRLVCGHMENQPDKPYYGWHIAFVPIPSMNRSFTADGWIRRVLVVGYGCEAGKAKELFDDLVQNLGNRQLKDNGRSVGRIRRVDNEARDAVLKFFVGKEKPCRVWRTVTPIVLTGMMRRGRAPSKLVVRALKQAGIDEKDIESIATYSGPIVPKTVHAMDYRMLGYLADSGRYHAEVILKRPLIGPLVVGRGRYSGFGLMMPHRESP